MKNHQHLLATGSGGISGFILFLILMVPFRGFAGHEDSLKGKYDINDPRNPKCPCHKYQKIADEEYKKLLLALSKDKKNNVGVAADIKPPSEKISGNSGVENLSGSDGIKKRRSEWSERFRSKKKIKKHTRWHKFKESVHKGFWRRYPNTDSCFKWKK